MASIPHTIKRPLLYLAWAFVAAVVLYAVVNPNSGVIHQGPLAPIGVGLIGLGICLHARAALNRKTFYGQKQTRR